MRVILQQADEIDRVNKEKEEQTHKSFITKKTMRDFLERGKYAEMIKKFN